MWICEIFGCFLDLMKLFHIQYMLGCFMVEWIFKWILAWIKAAQRHYFICGCPWVSSGCEPQKLWRLIIGFFARHCRAHFKVKTALMISMYYSIVNESRKNFCFFLLQNIEFMCMTRLKFRHCTLNLNWIQTVWNNQKLEHTHRAAPMAFSILFVVESNVHFHSHITHVGKIM